MIIHYRWRTGRLVSCGSTSTQGTEDPVRVSCPQCRKIITRAEILAEECGCHSVRTHAVMASLQVQRQAGLS